jgi:Ca2+:H+ antiporter
MFEDNTSQVFHSTRYPRRNKESAAPKTEKEGSSTAGADQAAVKDEESQSIESEEETPTLNIYVTIGLLVVVTVVCGEFLFKTLILSNRLSLIQLVAVTAEWLVDSIQGLVDKGTVSAEFVGIILLPIVGNAAGGFFNTSYPQVLIRNPEHVTAVTVSVKDKLNLSLSVAAGSSLVSSWPFLIPLERCLTYLW